MVNSPPVTRVAKKLLPGNGVNSLLPVARLLFPFSARVTHARDSFFAPETIARRCSDRPPSIWMEDSTRDTRDARKSAVGQWGKWAPAPFVPLSVLTLRYNGCGARVSEARHASRERSEVRVAGAS